MTELFRLGLQLLSLLLVLGGAAWVLLRLGHRKVASERGVLELVARLPLEGRRAIYLVRAGRRVLVVGGSESGLTQLADFDSAELHTPSDLGDLALSLTRGERTVVPEPHRPETPATPHSARRPVTTHASAPTTEAHD